MSKFSVCDESSDSDSDSSVPKKLRLIGSNFAHPTLSVCDDGASNSGQLRDGSVPEKNWDIVLRDLYDQSGMIENDPAPYENDPDYDGLDPKFPDRRWWKSCEVPRVIHFINYDADNPRHTKSLMGTPGTPWWQRSGPFPLSIAPEDYEPKRLEDWLSDERRERDDWDAEDEELICVSPFLESEPDIEAVWRDDA